MKLDKRINSIEDVYSVGKVCYEIPALNKYIGDFAYCSNKIESFENLANLRTSNYGTFGAVSDQDGHVDYVIYKNNDKTSPIYNPQYIVFVRDLEPVYRPFTLKEFEEHFKIGDTIRYQYNKDISMYRHLKGNPLIKIGQITAYEYDATDMDDSLRVYISGLETPLNSTDLLNYIKYLPENAHRWIPFGTVSEVE